jgi:hypothetical protein
VNARTRDARNNDKLVRLTIIGGIFMALAGSALHFVYNWFGQSTLLGLLAPVNESVWEHAKLVLLPPLLWYCFVALSVRRGSTYELVGASAVVLWFMPLFQIAFYYSYAAIAHGDLFVMDIVDFVLTVVLGQALFYQLVTRLRCTRAGRVAAALSIVALAGIFAVFTVRPPHILLFMDSETRTYGLPMK